MKQSYTSQVIAASYHFRINLRLLEIAAKRDQQLALKSSVFPNRPRAKAGCTWWKWLQEVFISALSHSNRSTN